MKNTALWMFSVSCITGTALAGGMGPINQQTDFWVATLSMGPVWQNSGKTQTLLLTPRIKKTYTNNNSVPALFDGEVFLGIQKSFSERLHSQVGLALAAATNATFSGDVWDDGNPIFNNYTYTYKVQHTHLAVKGKLLDDIGYWLIPWVSGSLGVGFNDAHSFHDTPINPDASQTPDYGSNTSTTFTYTLGAGFQKAINVNWQVGIGYEFADWGRSKLGGALGQTLDNHLTLNHIYTNGVLFNLTYLA